jgi:hypothetical protein
MRERERSSNHHESQQRWNHPPVTTPERPNHRRTAFVRCGFRSIGCGDPAIHRQANTGHKATTPGNINSLRLLGAPATLGSSWATARGKNSTANATPASAYNSNIATTTWASASGMA